MNVPAKHREQVRLLEEYSVFNISFELFPIGLMDGSTPAEEERGKADPLEGACEGNKHREQHTANNSQVRKVNEGRVKRCKRG